MRSTVPDLESVQPSRDSARRFLRIFLGVVLAAALAVAGGLGLLGARGLLPAPPATATWCFNEKFAFLRDAPLADRTLVAVGSSATWRNLDMALLERGLPGTRPINAAPCFLQMDQTAFLAEFLLARMPQARTVIAVLAPRDFESCSAADAAFFDPGLVGAYLDERMPGWLLHLVGFRPVWLAREVLRRQRLRAVAAARYGDDAYGTSVMRERAAYWPAPVLDAGCDAALTRLEALVAAHGARLVVATVPVMPAWSAAFDPDGTLVEGWVQRLRAALQRPETVLVDGRALAWDDGRFADPVHLLDPHHGAFTEILLAAIAARDAGAPG
jgi:hypothetical protein